MKNKHHKELVIILLIVTILALTFFLEGGITGFTSFSIYPEETITSEEFDIQPIKDITPTKEKDAGFKIQPIEEIQLQEQNETFELPIIEDDTKITEWTNQTDGFSTSAIGSTDPRGITTNNSDFWLVDNTDAFIYHLNSTGDNQTDGFDISSIGLGWALGITTNDTDFWIVDYADSFVYHVDKTGNNQTDGFSTSAFGAKFPHGITTNNTDFWILDTVDFFVYHIDSSFNNQTDGFSTLPCGAGNARDIATNNTDFWILDSAPLGGDNFIYHLNSTGNNQTDGYSIINCSRGNADSEGLTTNGTDLWITDNPDDFVYHIHNLIPNAAPTITPLSGSHYPTNNTNMIGYWRFDNDATDSSPQSNNGIINGAKHTFEGRVGKGYEFDGNDYINSTLEFDYPGTSSLTFALWLKFNSNNAGKWLLGSLADTGTAVGGGDDTLLDFQISSITGKLQFRIRNVVDNGGCAVWAETDNYLNDTQWHHITGVLISNKSISIYVDGALNEINNTVDLAVNNSVRFNFTNYPFLIGTLNNRGAMQNAYFNGTIDEVIIYNTSLSASQIEDIYNSTRGQYGVDADTGIKTNFDLGCGMNTSDADNDNLTHYEIRWYNTLILNTTVANYSDIKSGNTTKDDYWHCEARTYDGSVWSSWINSSNLFINNTKPVINQVILNTTNPSTNNTLQNLTCWNFSITDKDKDSVKTIFNWWYNSSSAGDIIPYTILNMPFEGISAKDYSGYRNDGLVRDATYNSTGGRDGFGAYEFDGKNDNISIEKKGLFTHASTYQETPTFDGSNQTVHPDIYFNKTGWNGWKYWLTFTPYPDNVYANEKISILVSNDSSTWQNITANPIYVNTSADPEFVYVNGELRVYFITTILTDHLFDGFWYTNSTDGINWGPARNLFNVTSAREILSPSIVLKDNLYTMWAVNTSPNGCTNKNNEIVTYNSTDGLSWNGPYPMEFEEPSGQNFEPWHLDVDYIPSKNEYWMTYVSYVTNCMTGGGLRIFFANSTDGINWKTWEYPLLNEVSHGWGNGTLYKSTILYNSTSDLIRMWYSAKDTSNKWHIGYTENTYSSISSQLNKSFVGKDEGTFCLWFKPNKIPTNYGGLIGDRHNKSDDNWIQLNINSNSKIEFGCKRKGTLFNIISGSNYAINTWQHICGVWDTSGIYKFLNGNLDESDTSNSCTSIVDNLNTLIIGNYYNYSSFYSFNGTIDDVRIYSKALSANQIQLLYENKSYMIHSDETSADDHWKCQVYPNDGTDDGSDVNSSELKIFALPTKPPLAGGFSKARRARLPEEYIEEPKEEKGPIERKEEEKETIIHVPSPKKTGIKSLYHQLLSIYKNKALSFLYLIGIIIVIFLIIKQIKSLRKLPEQKKIIRKIIVPKLKPELVEIDKEDYVIVNEKKKLLSMFNHLLIDTLEDLRKEKYHIARDSYDELLKIYNKLKFLKGNKKYSLSILLNEIDSQIDLLMLKQKIDTPLKTPAIINTKKQKIIIILDGASGDPALEKAKTPTLNYLAENGKTGIMYPIKGIAPESGAAQFSILGYPLNKYPGRGPIEALGSNYKIKNETALRCNFATFKKNKIIDYRISIPSKDLIKKLNKIDKDIKIIPTIGYRAVMIIKNAHKIKNTHPGYITYKNFSKAIIPKMKKIKSGNKKIDNFIKKAEKILKNKTILIRGAGNKLPKLRKLKNWILMADAPVEVGLGRLLGMEIKQKKNIIKQIQESKKNIYIQIKGPDTYAHKKDLKGKIKSIEKIDKLLQPLTKEKNKIICITCDHSTPYNLGIHSKDPVPVLIYGKDKDKSKRFTIKECKKGSLKTFNSKDLMKKL